MRHFCPSEPRRPRRLPRLAPATWAGPGPPRTVVLLRGAAAAAGRALAGARFAQVSLPALINGTVGVVIATYGRPISLLAFTITNGKIAEIDIIDSPSRIAEAELTILEPPTR